MTGRLEEAENAGLRGGKKAIAKLENRVQELSMELDSEQRRHNETRKGISKQERRLKELAAQADDDRKNNERAADNINKLNDKIKSYQRAIEEVEEVASINLSKFRKAQTELEDAEERADMAEQTLGKLRAKFRVGSEVK